MTQQLTVPRTSRRPGYVAGIAVNAVLLWLVHGWPGWEVVPFLTDETPRVLGWVTASLVVGVQPSLPPVRQGNRLAALVAR